MKRLLVSLLSLGLVSLSLAPAVSADTTITGSAMRCSGLAACTFTLSGSAGTGSASTYGGTITLHLPGEQVATYGSYSYTYVPDGYSSTAGSLYLVTGTFSTLDATTGTTVFGSTSVIEGEKGHSGRGGGIYWTLVSGSITVHQSTQRISKTALVCSPTSLYPGNAATCVVTVTDPGVNAGTPTGTVDFSQSPAGSGTFSPGSSCTLASGTCSVTLNVSINALNSVVVTASYAGDGVHVASTASQTIIVNEDS
jgi:hypothetical protein